MKRVLVFVLLAGAALLACIGVVVLGVNLYSARSGATELSNYKPPLDRVDAKQIAPADVLVSLAGVPDLQAIDDSLAQGDWEAAFALVAYSPDMSDANRSGTLLLLGSRYTDAKQPDKAAWCYNYAAILAIISPALSDLTRIQTLLEASNGLHALGLQSDARARLDQAYLIAQYSAGLPRDSRAHALSQIAQAYQDSGVTNLSTQAKRKSEEASALTAEDAVLETYTPFRLPLVALPDDPQLNDLTKNRLAAAKELVDQLNLKPPKTAADLPADLIRNLGDKLYYEDGTRLEYYQTQLRDATNASIKVELLRDYIRWLSLKLRVARGAFGISLVSEWESDARNITAALEDAENQLFQVMEQQAGLADKAADADMRTEDVLRTELVNGRWGLYQVNESDVRGRLDGITQRLRDEQIPTLRLDSYQANNQTIYLLVPDELYGQGERALPR